MEQAYFMGKSKWWKEYGKITYYQKLIINNDNAIHNCSFKRNSYQNLNSTMIFRILI